MLLARHSTLHSPPLLSPTSHAGFGDGTIPGTSTQWPCSLAMAATFDPILAERWGTAMGEEFWGKGTNIQEGPGVNVARIQKCG